MALLDPLLAGPLLGESIFSLAPGPKNKWFGPQSGTCICCHLPCVVVEFDEEDYGPKFEVISGTWPGQEYNTIYCSSGSGILLARKHEPNGLNAVRVIPAETPWDPTLFDIVFDYLDADNYQVLKIRDIASVRYFIVARVEAGVESPVATQATASDFGSTYLGFYRTQHEWYLFDNNMASNNVQHRFDALPVYGGTRFGFRANGVSTLDAAIREVYNYRTVDVAVDTNPPGGAESKCVLSLDNWRPTKCIHGAPTDAHGQWKVTIAGIAGTCGSLLNGTYYITPGYPIGGGQAYRRSWYYFHLDECDNVSGGTGDNCQLAVLLDSSTTHPFWNVGAGTAPGVNISAIYDGWVKFNFGNSPGVFFDCFDDWPQTLDLYATQTNDGTAADAAFDATNATCTVEFVFS